MSIESTWLLAFCLSLSSLGAWMVLGAARYFRWPGLASFGRWGFPCSVIAAMVVLGWHGAWLLDAVWPVVGTGSHGMSVAGLPVTAPMLSLIAVAIATLVIGLLGESRTIFQEAATVPWVRWRRPFCKGLAIHWVTAIATTMQLMAVSRPQPDVVHAPVSSDVREIVTDGGRSFAPYRALSWAEEKSISEKTLGSLDDRLILLAEPDPNSNCHGWVFGDGDCLIGGDDVELLLEDNGYVAVDEPVAGDVIVYRNDDGAIVHSGLVKSVLADGTTLIESKFGVGGCFLHRPEDQPYTDSFAFFRTKRASHTAILRRTHEPAEASNDHPRGLPL